MEQAKKEQGEPVSPRRRKVIYNDFAGATINGCVYINKGNGTMNIGRSEEPVESVEPAAQRHTDKELALAIEKCQPYFWSSSAYAVLFCICRDKLNMQPSKKEFETWVENLPYQTQRNYTCKPGTVSNAFSNNPIFREDVSNWDKFNAPERILNLRDHILIVLQQK